VQGIISINQKSARPQTVWNIQQSHT